MARRRKSQMTVTSRFLIFLIIFAPLAYIGASFINGEDGIQNFKNIFGGGDKTESPEVIEKVDPTELKAEIARLERVIKERDARIEILEEELRNTEE